MLTDWKTQLNGVHDASVKLAEEHPKIARAMGALEAAAAAEALDDKTRELISLAVAVTTHCDFCIAAHTARALKAGASEAEVAGALATAIAMNAGAAYAYSLKVFEAYESLKDK